ncbi:sugar phosphate nucleotidyltransferase [Bowmanella sp. JS7-9]|uniref:Sugar phosphate nucleotidyltransferase n=2 Tax=Pseudobowmanella zhangzhouensis TaxID=1537679 RepID=A0ABW1XL12_9ALTE|nr:sugar phosphate nucleotidyltransferase [Bowmanella sp. JS7-9]TBX25867.1 mannose-1-phosphate guanyltransferase [Bowmanella sp. JS7-9]
MQAIILAGGLGSRLKPFTEVVPKPLLPLGEKSILEIQIERLRDHGVTQIFLAVNYKADYIESFLGNGERYGVELIYSRESKALGTCGPLSLIRDQITGPFVMMNGDILTKLDFSRFYQFGCDKDFALTVGTKIITTPFRFGDVKSSEDQLLSVTEKPELNFEIMAGIYFMTPKVFDYIPEDTYFGMDNLITTLLAQGQPIGRYLIREYWVDIGMIEDYEKAKKEYPLL